MNLVKRNISLLTPALLIGIILLGFFIRMIFVLGDQPPLSHDAKNYDVMVKQFITQGFLGYMSDTPNAYVVPGYPLFLSLIYLIFGFTPESPLFIVKIAQAILGTASIFLVYLIGREVTNKRVGIISALLFAIYLPFSSSVILILTEVLYTFFFLLYLYIQLKALKSSNSIHNILAGILFGAAVLIRPTLFPLFALPYIYQYIVSRDKKLFKCFGFMVLGLVITLLPWWLRNYLTLGQFILLSTGNSNPLFAGTFPNLDFSHMKYVPISEQFDEGIRRIVNGFLTQPLTFLKWYTIGKLKIIFGHPWYISTRFQSGLFLHHIIVVLGFTGMLFAIISKKVRLIALYIILLIGLQLLFIPDARYAYSILPLLIILASHILDHLFFENSQKKLA